MAGTTHERLSPIGLGPLTNLALARRLEADALRSVGRMVWMGGAVDVPGNVTADAEFNAYVDPEAAGEVFEAGLRGDLVPRDATGQTRMDGGQPHAALPRRPGPAPPPLPAFAEQTSRPVA